MKKMAHECVRQVTDLYQKLKAASPIVGIFGHRQVGKTTLADQLGRHYVTFDNKESIRAATEDPAGFLKKNSTSGGTLVLDECQLVPDLFPALKEAVRVDKRPGRFLLTGSVRFSSRKAIRESLTGRMLTLELFPFVLSELQKKPLPDTLPLLISRNRFDQQTPLALPRRAERKQTQKVFEIYLRQGGLPGLCFLRNDRLRAETLRSLHQLILDRDLRLIAETRLSLETLGAYLAQMAGLGFRPYVFSDVTRKLGIAVPTQKSLLYALEATFMIRRVPLEGKKGFLVLLEDQYEEWLLSEGGLPEEEQYLSAFFRNARAQFSYRLGQRFHWSSFWLNTGSHVPLVLHSEARQLGFMVLGKNEAPSISQSRSALRFLRQYPQGKVIYLSPSPERLEVLDERILVCPLSALL